jgi:hypothetical protein
MIHKCFSIYDEKAGAFITPFFLPNEQMAVREFAAAANDPNHKFGKWPADYTLFEIGDFNIDTGELTPNKRPIATAVEYIGDQQ